MVTIKDIAREAGVSISTVSRVINNPDSVVAQKRERVSEVIFQMGYTPNAAAREMVTGSTKLIGVLVSDIRNAFIAALLTVFTEQLEKHGYSVFIGITGMDKKKEAHYVEIMRQKRVEAVTMFGVRRIDVKHDEEIARRLSGTPVIKVGPAFGDCYHNISTDEERGAFLATEYLIGLGHKRIGLITGRLECDSYYCKQLGFQRAMSAHNVLVYADYVYQVAADTFALDAYEPARKMLSLETRPTAVLLSGDQWALGVYRAAAEKGLRVPEDLSVVGYGNSPLSECLYPALTTVNQATDELGMNITRMLMEILKRDNTQRKVTRLDAELLVRASCAAPGL